MLVHLLFVIFVKIVIGDSVIRINNISEFKSFVKNVNSGNNYPGTTVYLDSDLSFSGETFSPIGKDSTYYFSGIFDGQGHTISDLKMNTSSQSVGLFGYSERLTIRNVVLDSSCSITGSYSGSGSVYISGVIGHYESNSGPCIIENIVNMARVSFSGNILIHDLHIGGIVGVGWTLNNYNATIKNCVNYGDVVHEGTVSGYCDISGIVGHFIGGIKYIQNCINYGTICHNGTTTRDKYIGGIVGYIPLSGTANEKSFVENCLSTGEVRSNNETLCSKGGIVGSIKSTTNITHCYYTNDVGVSNLYAYASSTPTVIETPTSPSTVNSTLIAKLKNYTAKNDTWNRWLLNINNASVSFIINYGKGFTVNSQIILFPDLANSSGRNFSGWYTDANLTTLFKLSQVESNTTLYGMFCGSSKYTVTLNVNGGNELSENENEMTAGCMNYYGPFPENVTRTGYILTGWFTEREGGDKVEPGDKVKTLRNHTLYAQWVINNYTVTFDFDNGTTVDKTFTYNTSVEYPKNEDMKRQGYIFNGWDKTVANMPAQDITITALWRANNYTVAFDVNGGDKLSISTVTVTFNNSYEPLPTPSKEGYMFFGWFTDNNKNVKNESIVSIADNHTLHAHWEKVTNHVEIVFSTKDLTEEEVKEIVRKYTDAEFTITEFGEVSGDIRVIIKFIDNEDAVGFIRNVSELSKMDNIKKISFDPNNDASSIPPLLCPIMFFNVIGFII